jgi:hypothetical protein
MTEIDETMKAYRLHVWRDHLDRPCSVCGSVTYRSLNTQANGLRVCGQCARPDAPPHCPECGSRSLVLICGKPTAANCEHLMCCPSCNGKGYKRPDVVRVQICRTCGGSGKVKTLIAIAQMD